MKRICFLLLFVCSITALDAQYILYKEVDGVQFHTKWGREKWLSKKSPKVLMVKVVNTGSSAADFNLGVSFFKNLIMIEESKTVFYCLSAGKTILPRMAGLMFKPAGIKAEEIDSFELTGLEITKRTGSACAE